MTCWSAHSRGVMTPFEYMLAFGMLVTGSLNTISEW